MAKTELPMAIAAAACLLVESLGPMRAMSAAPPQVRDAPKSAEVQAILDKYQAIRPDADDLSIYGLDWMPSLKAAREKAAKERRPILLMVVHNSYGNLYTGHC